MKKLTRLFTYSLVLAALAGGWLWLDVQSFLDTPMNVPQEGVRIEVEQGSHLTRIARQLAEQDIITHPQYLRWYARFTRQADRIHIGEYELMPGMTPRDFLHQLVEGKVIQYSITIVEGWTFVQLLEAVHAHNSLVHQLEGLDTQTIMARLGYPDVHPEGQFMPDTYFFPRGLSDVAFLQRAYRAMQDFLEREWPQRDVGLPIKTPYEALILASIVEKETGLTSERRTIAGVFTRRLLKGMRLQTDPTVIYGMGESYQGNIRRRDLQTATPYNTYLIQGLPPTPIAMPGRDSIRATLHPEEGDALYFVSMGDGSHYFSSTLEEHNEAVIKYQLKGRKRPFSSSPSDKKANQQ